MNLKKLQFLLAATLSCGIAHAQSVVIEGGNVRVDAGTAGKVTVGAKPTKTHAVKKSKAAIVHDSDEADNATVMVNSSVSSGSGSASSQSEFRGGKEFVNSDLSGQNLSRRNYAGASFTNVEAVGTNFNGANLSKTVMTNVDLSKADLRGANLAGAKMVNVDWDGALLGGATWVDGRRCAPVSTGKCM
jgi:hypothetical protein